MINLLNKRNTLCGLSLMRLLEFNCVNAAFFDPQYRGFFDFQYENEGKSPGQRRENLPKMSHNDIAKFLVQIERVLVESGYLFLWCDKFHLYTGVIKKIIMRTTTLKIVDLITWDKMKIGRGHRTRISCEYLLIIQKPPIKAKRYWMRPDIRDVWRERVDTKYHLYAKPIDLQKALIEAVTEKDDVVIDPAMGSGSVWVACTELNRHFIGTDIRESFI